MQIDSFKFYYTEFRSESEPYVFYLIFSNCSDHFKMYKLITAQYWFAVRAPTLLLLKKLLQQIGHLP